MNQFFVIFRSVKVQNGNPIVQLQSKTLGLIVDQNHVFKLPVLNDSHILYYFSFLSPKAVVPAKEVLNNLWVFIQFFYDCFSVFSCCSSENINIVVLWDFFKKLHRIWSNVKLEMIWLVLIYFCIFLTICVN